MGKLEVEPVVNMIKIYFKHWKTLKQWIRKGIWKTLEGGNERQKLYNYIILSKLKSTSLSQQLPLEQIQTSNLHSSRPKPTNPIGPGPGQQLLWEQAWDSDTHERRPKLATFNNADPSHRLLSEQAQASNLHMTRPEQADLLEQVWISNLCIAGSSQWPPCDQAPGLN